MLTAVSANDKAMLLVVYGDSLSLPRRQAGIRHQDTYAELVLKCLPESPRLAGFYNRSMAGTPIGQMRVLLEGDTYYFGQESPSCCVIQLGIVDCAPRPVLGRTKRKIDRLPPLLKRVIVGLIRRLRPTLIKNQIFVRETPPGKFLDDLSVMISAALSVFDFVAVLNICPNHPVMEARSPRISESIFLYNGLIDQAVASSKSAKVVLVDVHSAVAAAGIEGIVSAEDGHHITLAGHKLYAELLTTTIAARIQVRN